MYSLASVVASSGMRKYQGALQFVYVHVNDVGLIFLLTHAHINPEVIFV
jgi:hypothetical protein